MFFPSLLEMSSELPGRGMQAIPWSWGMTWELRYMGAIRGEGPWLPASPGLSSLDGSVILPHRWRLAFLSLSPPDPQASCTYQLCAKHTARLFLPTSNSDSSQITAEDIGRCTSMLCKMSDRESSWWNYDEIEEKNSQRVRKGMKNYVLHTKNVESLNISLCEKCKQPGYLHI